MRVAVLGQGSIGTRHARNLRSLGHHAVGFDPLAASVADGVTRAASLEAALDRAEAVIVASPTSEHAQHALIAVDRGLPVLVEKPLAATAADARRLSEAAGAAHVTCGVAMNLRFHPAIEKLRELVRSGVLGPIRLAQVSTGSDLRTWRPHTDYRTTYSAQAALGGGVVRDAIHELDYVTWMLGRAVTVTAEAGHVSDLELDVEDLAVALLRFGDGAIASVDLSYVDRVYRRSCLLVGAEGTARWDWNRGEIVIDAPEARTRRIDVTADVADTYVEELRDFLNAAQSGRRPRTDATEGAWVTGLAEAVLTSARSGRRISL